MVMKQFENDVKMYGAQAALVSKALKRWFENDVKMYGAQAQKQKQILMHSLKMM